MSSPGENHLRISSERDGRRRARFVATGLALLAGPSAATALIVLQAGQNAERMLAGQASALVEILDTHHRFPKSQAITALRVLRSEAERLGSAVWYPPPARGQLPELRFGGTALNGDARVVTKARQLTGAAVAFFVRDGDRFVRVTPNAPKAEGLRPVPSQLDFRGKPVASSLDGRPYYGVAEVQGVPHMIGYEPLRGPAGSIIGIAYAASPVHGAKAAGQLIAGWRSLEHGFVALVDGRGQVLATSGKTSVAQARELLSPSRRPLQWRITEVPLADWNLRLVTGFSWFDAATAATLIALAFEALAFALAAAWVLRQPRRPVEPASAAEIPAGAELGSLKKVLPVEWLPSDRIDPLAYRTLFESLVRLPRSGKLTAQLKLKNGMYFLRLMDDGTGTPGQGAGLDAIRAEVKSRGGDLHVVNTPGKGTGTLVWFRAEGAEERKAA